MADSNTVETAAFDDAPASGNSLANVVATGNSADSNAVHAPAHSNVDADTIPLDGVRLPPDNALKDVNGHYLFVSG